MELLIREAKNKSPMLHDSTPEALKKLTIAYQIHIYYLYI